MSMKMKNVFFILVKDLRGLSASDLIYCVVAPQENCSTQKQSVCEKFNRMFSILEERQKVRVQPSSSVMSGPLVINVCRPGRFPVLFW